MTRRSGGGQKSSRKAGQAKAPNPRDAVAAAEASLASLNESIEAMVAAAEAATREAERDLERAVAIVDSGDADPEILRELLRSATERFNLVHAAQTLAVRCRVRVNDTLARSIPRLDNKLKVQVSRPQREIEALIAVVEAERANAAAAEPAGTETGTETGDETGVGPDQNDSTQPGGDSSPPSLAGAG